MNTENMDIKDVLNALDVAHVDMLGELEDAQSFLYFLCEFFGEECIDMYKLKKNEDRFRVHSLIEGFPHFRNIFMQLGQRIDSINTHSGKIGRCLSEAFELIKASDVHNETLHTDETPGERA